MDPNPPEANAASPAAGRIPVRLLLVSLAVIVGIGLLRWVRIPLVNRDLGSILLGVSAPTRGHVTLLLLGLAPVVSGYLLVELAALAVPRWRPLRLGAAAARDRLARAALYLTLGIAALQSFAFVRLMRSWSWIGHDALTFGLTWLALVAGVAVLVALMRVVDRWGLGSGFSVVLAGLLLNDVLGAATRGAGSLGTPTRLMVLALLLVVLPLAFQRSAEGLTDRAQRVVLPFPSSGLQPFLLPSLIFLGLAVTKVGGPALIKTPAGDAFAQVGAWLGSPVVLMALMLLSVPAFALLFAWPSRVLEVLARREPRGGAALARAARLASGLGIIQAAAFLLCLLGLQGLLARQRDPLDLVALVFLTAIGTDLVREFQFRSLHGPLRQAWPLHRVHAVAPALRTLGEAGVPAFPRGLHHRTLLQFFGPMVPVELLVPEGREAAAQSALEPLLVPARREA